MVAESSWNTDLPAKPRGRNRSIWILISMVLIVVGTTAGLALIGRASGVRRQAWPLVLTVNKRFSTDEGARDLYRRNPAVANGYESEEAFLDCVRVWRGKVGSLPIEEPSGNRDAYAIDADAFALSVACKGNSGGWVRARFVSGPAAGGQDVGEGLVQLVFGNSFKDLHEAARAAGIHARNQLWVQFRDLLLKLGADETAMTVYRSEPALQVRWATAREYLRDIQTWRPALGALPVEKPNQRKDPTQRVTYSREPSSSGESHQVRFRYKDGIWEATWRDGSLIAIDHQTAEAPGLPD